MATKSKLLSMQPKLRFDRLSTSAGNRISDRTSTGATNLYYRNDAETNAASFSFIYPASKNLTTENLSKPRTMQPKLRLLMVTLSVILFSFVTTLVNAQYLSNVGTATVTTDKPDYAPRSNAVFTGKGFAPGETVTLKVKNLFRACNTIDPTDSSYMPWTVVADGSGNFVTNWTVCDCDGDSLRLRAVGGASHDTAYAYFSDQSFAGTWTSVTPSNRCAGSIANYTLVATTPQSSAQDASVPVGRLVTITFPSGFGLSGITGGSVNSTAISSTITKTSTTVSFNTPVAISKNSSFTIVLNGIVNHGTANNYQLSMTIENNTGTGNGNQNTFVATTNSQFTINAIPNVAAIEGGASSICVNTTTPAFTNTTGGGTWSIQNGTGAASITSGGVVTGLTAGSVTVVYTVTSSGCSNTATKSLTVNALPANPANPTSNSPQCSDIGVTLTRANPPAGVTFYWQSSATGTDVSNSSNTLNATASGTYYLRAQNDATGCWSSGAGSLAVTVNPSVTPTISINGANSICEGVGVTFDASITNGGTTPAYQWKKNGLPVGANSSSYTDNALANGDVITCELTSNAACASPATVVSTNSITMLVNSAPTVFNVSFTGSLCGTATISLNGSESGVSYALRRNGTTVETVAGTGSAISFSATSSNGTYTVVATNTTTTCSSTMNGSVMLGGGQPPATFSVTGGGAYCSGGSGSLVGLSGSETGVNYQLYFDGSPVGTTVAGTGSALSFGNQTAAGTYTVIATKTSGGCTATMTGDAVVSINTAPSFTTQPTNQTATYGDASVQFSATATGTPTITYQWQVNTGSGFANVPGATSSTLTLNNPIYAMNGFIYHLVATNSCSSTTSDDVVVTVNKRLATWTTNTNSKTYGDADPNPLTTGSGNFLSADGVTATYTRAAGETVAGGPYHITATLSSSVANALDNYTITNAGNDFTISKRLATWTTNTNSKTYGDADPNPLTTGSGNFLSADGVTATYTRAAGETVAGGPYHITATLSSSVANALDNYTITNAGNDFTISKRLATWTTNTNSKTYGDADPNPLTTGSGNFLSADGVTATYTRAAGETVAGGPYHITATLSSSVANALDNYTITNAGNDFTISKRLATWTTNTNSKTYGDADPNPLTTGSGNFLSADGVTATYTRAAGETVAGGPYHITATLSSSVANALDNYTITNAGNDFTISKRLATWTTNTNSKTYGDADPNPLTTGSGNFLSADGVTATYTRAAGETVAGGPYHITATLSSSVANALDNYTITNAGNDFTISKRLATWTTNTNSKTYGDADPNPLTTGSGNFLSADGVTAMYTRAAGETVAGGPYHITATLSSSVANALDNYTITNAGNDFTISKRLATWTTNTNSKTYGDADPNPLTTGSGNFLSADGVTATYTRAAGETVAGGPYHITATLSSSVANALDNYTITNAGNDFTISKRLATWTTNTNSKTYGDADPNPLTTGSGNFLSADGVTATYTRAAGETVAGGPYHITATLSSSVANALDNYTITNAGNDFTISKRLATWTTNTNSKTYGDADPNPLTTGSGNFLSADGVTATYTRAAGETVAGGPYHITATLSSSVANALDNYTITNAGNDFTISKRLATWTTNTNSKTYGDADPNPLTTGSGNFLSADGVTATYTRAAGETVAGGPYHITATLSSSVANALDNYTITNAGNDFTISKRLATWTTNTNSKTYGDADPNPLTTGSGNFLSADGVTATYTRAAGETVAGGPYHITATLSSSVANALDNYTITNAGNDFTISKRLATWTTNTNSKTYGDADPNPLTTGSGNFLSADGVTATYTRAAGETVAGGPYHITATLSSSVANALDNYTITNAGNDFTISKRLATWTTNTNSKTYGDADPNPLTTGSGNFLSADGVTATYTRAAGETVAGGPYHITATLSSSVANALDNYTITNAGNDFTISKRLATWTTNTNSKTYGDADPNPLTTGSGNFLSADGVTATYTRAAGETVAGGPYHITATLSSSVANALDNYTITNAGNDFTISKRLATWTTNTNSKTYGDADPNPLTTGSGNFLSADGVTATYTRAAGETVAGGPYHITATLSSSVANALDNYTITNAGNDFTISKRLATWTTNTNSKTYGDADPNPLTTGSGNFLSADGVTATYTRAAGETVAGGPYHITATLSSSVANALDNYTITNAGNDFTISKRLATWTTNTNSKTYGDADPNPLTTGSGNFLSADGVTATYTRAAGETVAGGPYHITATLSSSVANALDNYTITNAGNDFTISKRLATWTTNTNSKTYGDADPNPLTTGSGNFLSADGVTATYTRAAGETVAGGPYHITATLSSSVANALDNYTITNAGNDFTISKRLATWTTNTNSKTYGDADPNPLTTGSGNFLSADGVTATYTRAAGETVAGGPYHITATLSSSVANALDNYTITNAGNDFTISKRLATWTTNTNSKTYGDADPNPLTTGSGNFLSADGVTAMYTRAAGETVAGGPYHITATLSSSVANALDNYTITNAGNDFTISKRLATWTTNTNSKTYGDADPNPLTTGSGNFLSADGVTATYTRAAGETVAGGPYHITATLSSSVANALDNYTITNAGNDFTISKRLATWTTNTNSKTYGDADPNPLTTGSGNFLSADGVTATYTRAAGETVAGGPYHITATLSSSVANALDNYTITNAGNDFTISKRLATWTTNTNSKTYGDADPNPLTTGSGNFLSADGVTATYTRAAGETVAGGPYHITATLSSSVANALDNYTITNAGNDFTISKRLATWTTNTNSKTYGDADPNPLTTGSGNFLSADGVTATYTRAAGETVAGGPYHITATLSSSVANALDNYTITNAGNDFTISKRLATWTTNTNSKTYGDADPNPLTTGSGNFLSADGVTATYTRAAGETVAGGPYHITATLSSSVANALDNYTITNAGNDFTISKRLATWTTNTNSKTYGDADPNPLTTGSGNFLSADGVTATYTRAAGETVAGGPYHITATLSSSVANALDNYTITNAGNDFTISKRLATWTTNTNSKTYGDADPNPLTTGSGNFLSADGVTATYTRAAGETVAGGPYHITATLSSSVANALDNYTITNAGNDFTISKRLATWTTNTNSKTYGDADPNPLTTGSGNFLSADGVTATYTRAAGETVAGGPYHITATLSSSVANALDNYTITNAGNDFTISKASLTVTANNITGIQYSDKVPAFTANITGFVNGDNVSVVSGTPGFTTTASLTAGRADLSGPGSYDIIPNGGTAPTQLAADNYSFTFVKGTLSIIQEDARIVYTGDIIKGVPVSGNTSPSVNFNLRANIYDISYPAYNVGDNCPGNITNARVKFVDIDGTPLGTGNANLTPQLVDGVNTMVGTVSGNLTLTIPSSSGWISQPVRIIVEGYYDAEDEIMLTGYIANGDFITGGGYIVPDKPSGSYASEPNKKANFGFNVKFNKNGKALQGNMNIIYKKLEGGVLTNVQIKNTSMYSLGVDATTKTAEFVSQVSVKNLTTGVPVDAKWLYVKMEDNEGKGTPDRISFILVKSANNGSPGDPTILNNIVWSSNWINLKTDLLDLGGGDLVVHSGFNVGSASIAKSTNPRVTDNTPVLEATATVLDAKAYPNPSTSQFNVKLESSNTRDAISIIVYNVNGNIVEQKQKLTAGQTIQFGALYRPGVYIVDVIQGGQRKQLKLVKTPD